MDSRGPSGGRSRGRARSQQSSSHEQQQQQQAGQQVRRPGPPRAPDASYGPPTSSVGRSVRAPVPSTSHGGDRQPGKERPTTSSDQPPSVGGGGDASTVGRGAMRGRRVINPDILVTRPAHTQGSKKGTIGQPIKLQANFFKIVSAPDWCLFQYRVDFAPEEDRTVVRKGLLRLHKERLGTYLFDGTLLYTCNRYANVTNTEAMKLYSERTSDGANIELSIRLVGEMSRGDPHYPQFFNIIMRRGLEHLRLQLVGRNYFDARARIEIREYRFELWPGYQTSIRQHEQNVLMAVEITSKVMRQDTILEIMNNIRQNCRGDVQAACRSEIIGMTVLTDYNNNTYRVEDIDFAKNPTSDFELRKKINDSNTYMNYYRTKYGINIRNPTQPLLVTRPSLRNRRGGTEEILCLIPELCRATGLTDGMRADYKLMNALAEHTRIQPQTRIQRLLAFNTRLQKEPAVVQEFTQWKLRLDTDIVELPARTFPVENIQFGGQGQQSAGQEADWTRCLQKIRLIVTKELSNWIIFAPSRIGRDNVNKFVDNIQKAGFGMSFRIGKPQVREMRSDYPQSYAEELEEAMRQSNPQLICCVAMRQRADVYSAIKRKCCVDRPVPSQVVLMKNLNNPKGALSVATKIAVQLNCKIGGSPWSLNFGTSGLMVVGFDVCHDPNQRGTDFGAMVASLDRGMGQYFSAVSAHRSNEELTNEFSSNMVKAIRKYAELNGNKYPARIVIYRDGVGDGQIPYVLDHEVKNLRENLEKFYPKPDDLKMAFIIVTKRINVRLFQNRRDNPPAGTVVDDVITNPCRYDFFIVSQFVRRGSVSPTAYNVIYDNAGLEVSAIQHLTYRLTHMYFNWSGTVRVPAPCQYAHKLAFLVAQSIHQQPSSHLESLLYFL